MVTTSRGHNLRASTDVHQEKAAVTDPVVGSYLRHLEREKAQVSRVLVSFDGPYMIYTEVRAKSATALDKVYRAEAKTQHDYKGGGIYPPVALIFEHRNVAVAGSEEVASEFLERGSFLRVL